MTLIHVHKATQHTPTYGSELSGFSKMRLSYTSVSHPTHRVSLRISRDSGLALGTATRDPAHSRERPRQFTLRHCRNTNFSGTLE